MREGRRDGRSDKETQGPSNGERGDVGRGRRRDGRREGQRNGWRDVRTNVLGEGGLREEQIDRGGEAGRQGWKWMEGWMQEGGGYGGRV